VRKLLQLEDWAAFLRVSHAREKDWEGGTPRVIAGELRRLLQDPINGPSFEWSLITSAILIDLQGEVVVVVLVGFALAKNG